MLMKNVKCNNRYAPLRIFFIFLHRNICCGYPSEAILTSTFLWRIIENYPLTVNKLHTLSDSVWHAQSKQGCIEGDSSDGEHWFWFCALCASFRLRFCWGYMYTTLLVRAQFVLKTLVVCWNPYDRRSGRHTEFLLTTFRAFFYLKFIKKRFVK